MMKYWKSLTTTIAVGAIASIGATPTNASTILSFSQQGIAADFTATRAGSVTTLNATDLLVDIGGFFAGGTPINGVYFDFNATNVGAALNSSGLGQDYDGTFSFNSMADNSGLNYLQGTFASSGTDANDLTGTDGGSAASFRETTLGLDNLAFTSDFGTFLGQLGISLSFISVDPALGLGGNPLSYNTLRASVSGNFEADQAISEVPEPASLLLLGGGMVGVVALYRRRQSQA